MSNNYKPTKWLGGKTIGTAQVMNNIEQGISNAHDRLDSVDSQIKDIASVSVLRNIDGTDIKAGTKVDFELLRTKQITLLGRFYRDLRERKNVKICCYGDSITYGYDEFSADKRQEELIGAGTVASKTYPERLQEVLDYVYPNVCHVEKKGYTGDGVKQGFNRWEWKTNANLSFIMYGINDAWGDYTGYAGNIDEYIKHYEQLIIQLLLQGSAVIILTPTKAKNCKDTRIKSYGDSLHVLGQKYGIPVINTDEFTYNYGHEIYSDETHFNGTGYSILGAKISSLVIGRGVNTPMFVNSGTVLLPRLMNDSCVLNNAELGNYNNTTCYEEGGEGGKGIMTTINPGGCITFSFYCEQDNLKAIPYFTANDVNFIMTLDYQEPQPRFSNTDTISSAFKISNPPSSKKTKHITSDYKYDKNEYLLNGEDLTIDIVLKGWHSITIQNTGTSPLFFVSLEFISLDTIANLKKMNAIVGYTHNAWSANPIQVQETSIKLDKLLIFQRDMDVIKEATFKDIPFELTVYTENESILKYVFVIGANQGNIKYLSTPNRLNIKEIPNERTCSSITLNSDILTINWGGALNALSSWSIKPY